MNKYSDRKEGGILILVAVLLGLFLSIGAVGLDYGRLALVRWQLQEAVDAAALAGALELGNDLITLPERKERAVNIAESIATSNYSSDYTVSFPNSRTCQVDGSKTVDLTLAKIMGLLTSTVNARARADVTSVGGINGLRPMGIEEPEEEFDYGELYIMKLGPGTPESKEEGLPGNSFALALGDSTGAAGFRDKLKYGYDGGVKVGDWLKSEPGNMAGPTQSAINYLIGLDSKDWTYYQSNPTELYESPRLIVLPVVSDWAGAVGRSEVQVVGFCVFFVEGFDENGNLIGRFIKKSITGAIISGGGDFGAYTTRLIQ